MNRLQIIVIALAALSIVGLYSLPRIVVDNDDNDTQDFMEQAMPESDMANHSAGIPEEVLPRVLRWKAELMLGGKIQDNESALDSLISVFREINKYDSAAHYAAAFADDYQEVKHWRKAGDAYYQAFTFAVDEAKVRQLAQSAKTYYNKILDSGENDLGARNNLAMMLVSTGNPMQGVMKLREILAEDPLNEKSLMNMGALSIESRQFEKAVERYKKVVDNYPENLQARYWLGVCYFETGRLQEAKEQLEKVKTMDTDPMVQTAVNEYLQRIK